MKGKANHGALAHIPPNPLPLSKVLLAKIVFLNIDFLIFFLEVNRTLEPVCLQFLKTSMFGS